MSTTTSALPWMKRKEDSKPTQFYYILESESSRELDEDTESVYSLQGKETDFVRDTSDTDASSYEVEIEYDIASGSDTDEDGFLVSSGSDSEDYMALAAAAAIANSSSFETLITDGEDSDNSQAEDSSSGLRDYWICIQCKSQNNNPQYRFCDKCFQDRKTFFPPRPRRNKKAKRKEEQSLSPVKLDALQSCLNGLSGTDSGIGSSQEFPALLLDQIVVPKHLSSDVAETKPSTSSFYDNILSNRKRQISESSLSEDCEYVKPPKRQKTAKASCSSSQNGEIVAKTDVVVDGVKAEENDIRNANESDVKGPLPEMKEICIMCNANPKNSVFLHGRIAHMCCCYKCAMKTWKSLKRCPICQRKVSNVVRVFTT